jgi:hypothetical protein
LPLNARKVGIEWSWKAGRPELSFENAVGDYEREYREKYEEFLRTGK